MKHNLFNVRSILKAFGIAQALVCVSMVPATAATVDLQVRSFAGNCGPGVREKTRTYELNGGPSPTNSVIDAPATAEIPLEVNLGSDSTGNLDGCAMYVRAYGMSGVLGLDGSIYKEGTGTSYFALSRLEDTNIFITPEDGQTYVGLRDIFGPDISVKPNLMLSGMVFANNGGSNAFITASAIVSGFTSTGGTPFAPDNAAISTGVTPVTGAIPITFSSDNQFTNGPTPFTDGIIVDPTQPLSLIMELRGGGTASFGFDGPGESQFDSYNSFSFNPNGPAFDVPDGFTVNAPGLGIFNNQWIDPRLAVVGPTPSTVPVPAAGWLLLSAGLALTVVRRRRVN